MPWSPPVIVVEDGDVPAWVGFPHDEPPVFQRAYRRVPIGVADGQEAGELGTDLLRAVIAPVLHDPHLIDAPKAVLGRNGFERLPEEMRAVRRRDKDKGVGLGHASRL